MAQGAGRVTEVDAPAPRDERAIAEDIMRRRGELTALVAELNRRRHELTDVKAQMRRHPVGLTLTVVAVAAAAAGSVALGIRRARRRNTPMARAGRLREALRRMIDRPERVAAEPTATQRILGAAGSAAAAFLTRAALEHFGEFAWPTTRVRGAPPGETRSAPHRPRA